MTDSVGHGSEETAPGSSVSVQLAPRRKRRSAKVRNSVRLGLLLVGLSALNVYVFFINRKTAPREILNPSSMTKPLDVQRDEAVKGDADSVRAEPVRAGGGREKEKGGSSHAAPVATDRAVLPQATAAAVAIAAVPQVAAAAAAASAEEASSVTSSAPRDESEAAGEEGGARVVEGKVGETDTLSSLLVREGLGGSSEGIIRALTKLADPKLIRPGQLYSIRFDEEGAPESFEYRPTPVLRYVVSRATDGSWKSGKQEEALDVRVADAAGVVESSLWESVQKSGEAGALVSLFVEIFAWDINFYIDTHPGDRWKVIAEKQYLGGQFYKYGRVLAAEYSGRCGTYRAFFWSAGKEQGGKYFDEKGQALAKTMLKTPLRFVRISSKFDPKRFHPVLHREKAHLGIDYAAPTGTPVWASAGGRVVEAGMKKGSGNTVVLAHSNGLQTRYYHLSRFAKGLRAGQQVRQKDVIGYVGSTGLSTGPHLHFSVVQNGTFVDPAKMKMNRDAPVRDRAAFMAAIRPRVAAMKAMQPGVLAQAAAAQH